MIPSRLRIIALASLAVVASARADQGGKPWPPALQPASQTAPVRSPDEEMKTFYLPPGYHVELVASEPLVVDPVVIDFDPEGRMWVIEMSGYMNNILATNEREPLSRIVVLEDTNADGKMDKRTVFADRLVLPRALKVLDHGVLVGEPPNLWFMQDTNGDLRVDTKGLVTDQYGRVDANVEHNANSLTWALDNWMYTSEVDIYLRLKHGKFQVHKTLSRGQWGASQDDVGRIYRNTNESVLHVDLVPTIYYSRHPSLLRTRGSYESLEGATNEVNAVFPVHPTPGVNRGYQNGVLRPDGTLAQYTSVCAPTVYRGDHLPKDLYGSVFVAEPAANLVSRIIVSDDGSTLRARRAYERGEFLASTDERFRPVYLSNAPDGTLYVVDLYRGIIQHRGYITEYLQDQIVGRKLELPIAHGRIYRIVHDTTRRDQQPALSKAPSATLVQLLSHPNGWWRDTAQRLLVERDDRSVVAALTNLATDAPLPRTRLHALWTLDGIDAIEPGTVVRALDDASRDVRASAIRLVERWFTDPNSPVVAAVMKRLGDPDWAVRRQLSASLGALPAATKEPALARLLEEQGDDPITTDAALSGLRDGELAVLDRLLQASVQTAPRDAATSMIAATIVRGGQDAPVQTVFDRVTQSTRPEWQRSALLRGAEIALLGALMPGSESGRGRGGATAATASCPMCPGGRQGPGDAAAFPQPGRAGGGAGTAARGGAGPGGAAPALKLSREPALVALAANDTGDLGRRAAAVVARLEWPGKPGAAAPATPLSPEEQQRFAAGQPVYQSLCQACHQPDGRGQEKVAATLIGSPLALGSPGIPIRVVLHGKEGAVGLMPPLGSVLTDEQIAAALTYIRRNWGHTTSAIDPATVKEIRALTSGRTKPWTNEELLALMK